MLLWPGQGGQWGQQSQNPQKDGVVSVFSLVLWDWNGSDMLSSPPASDSSFLSSDLSSLASLSLSLPPLPVRRVCQPCPDGETDLRNYVLIQLHICKSQPELLSRRNITIKTPHYQTYIFLFRQADHSEHLNNAIVQLDILSEVFYFGKCTRGPAYCIVVLHS